MQCETSSETSYEDGLLATLDTSNHEEVLEALLKVALILECDNPAFSFLGFCKRLDPAVKVLERGQSVKTLIQNLVPAVDVLDDSGKALNRFLRFSERLEATVRASRR